jgi:hypothetical protein
MLLILTILINDYFIINFHILQKNEIFYRFYILRENEFEIYKPLYFNLKEILFFKGENKKLTPYSVRFDWEMKINLFNLNFFYNHICNHGIDHKGEDRRQWNQIGFKKDFKIKNFYFLNSIGYVFSPFGPKRYLNNYNFIFLHKLIFEKNLKFLKFFIDLNFEGFYEIKKLKYETELKIYFLKNYLDFGLKGERKYGIYGLNDKKIGLKSIFFGFLNKIEEINFLYGHFFKNPNHSFFSKAFTKYRLIEKIKIFFNLETISPLKRQIPRFCKFEIGIEKEIKNLKLFLRHIERRDGNLYDGKTEKINSFEIELKNFSLNYFFEKKNFPYNFLLGINFFKKFSFIEYGIYLAHLYGKKEKGIIFEQGPECLIKDKFKISYKSKITSEKFFENYGIFEHRFFISYKNK